VATSAIPQSVLAEHDERIIRSMYLEVPFMEEASSVLDPRFYSYSLSHLYPSSNLPSLFNSSLFFDSFRVLETFKSRYPSV
jgi:hypothetical protein